MLPPNYQYIVSAKTSPFLVSPSFNDSTATYMLVTISQIDSEQERINIYLLRDDRIFTRTTTDVERGENNVMLKVCVLPKYALAFLMPAPSTNVRQQQLIYRVVTAREVCNVKTFGELHINNII